MKISLCYIVSNQKLCYKASSSQGFILCLFISSQMQDKVVILCCNLKPSKMRGVTSQAMVVCASSPDKVEILDPPAGAVPGDRISFQGYQSKCPFKLDPI